MRVNDCEAVTMVLTFLWFWLDIALTFLFFGGTNLNLSMYV